MKTIELKTRKLLRKIFGSITLAGVAFVFQACYGIEPDGRESDCSFDTRLSGTVLSKTTNLPIKGIRVFIDGSANYGITDENGQFDFYAYIRMCEVSPDNVSVMFVDIDGEENGSFVGKNYNIDVIEQDMVKINVELEEKI
jgi:hypothetical protein